MILMQHFRSLQTEKDAAVHQLKIMSEGSSFIKTTQEILAFT